MLLLISSHDMSTDELFNFPYACVDFLIQSLNEAHTTDLTVVTSLGRLAHPNIISLLGYSNYNEHRLLLVYEFVQMQRERNFSQTLGFVDTLSWERRLMIMIEVARGLAYLHSSKEQVIHSGIRTFNILLDHNFSAKLGYFGLAEFLRKFRDMEDATTNDMDTVRYLDRNDLLTGQLTTKSDIYSFGVVLFETLRGQRVWESKHGFTLVKWLRPFLANKRKIKGIIDQRLDQNYPLEGAYECVVLAAKCLAQHPESRPSSEEVLQSLEQIYSLTNNG